MVTNKSSSIASNFMKPTSFEYLTELITKLFNNSASRNLSACTIIFSDKLFRTIIFLFFFFSNVLMK